MFIVLPFKELSIIPIIKNQNKNVAKCQRQPILRKIYALWLITGNLVWRLKADYTIKGNDQIIKQPLTTHTPSDAHGLSKCHSQSSKLSINGTSKDHGRRISKEGNLKKKERTKKKQKKNPKTKKQNPQRTKEQKEKEETKISHIIADARNLRPSCLAWVKTIQCTFRSIYLIAFIDFIEFHLR